MKTLSHSKPDVSTIISYFKTNGATDIYCIENLVTGDKYVHFRGAGKEYIVNLTTLIKVIERMRI